MRTLIIMALLLLVGCTGGHAASGLQGGGAMFGTSKSSPVRSKQKMAVMKIQKATKRPPPIVSRFKPCPPPTVKLKTP